ncbi:MAG: hypothetical protein IBJ00_05500, partial [Alphaproteobacteria bacterium]|nr:hypothetical protein [Alphaproteobacteria bacterium]
MNYKKPPLPQPEVEFEQKWEVIKEPIGLLLSVLIGVLIGSFFPFSEELLEIIYEPFI